MKRFVIVVALAFALSGIAMAGEIPSTDIAAPAPQPTNAVITVLLAVISAVV